MEFPPVDTAPPGCENPKPTGWLVIGLGSWSQRAARVARLANVEVPPHPGRIGSYPRIRNPSIYPQLTPTTWGRERGFPGSIPPRRVCKPQSHWVMADWLRLMEPACGGSCPSGQRRGLAAPRKDKFPSPGQKSFHITTTPTTRGRQRRSPGSIPPGRGWTPQPNWLVADWLGPVSYTHLTLPTICSV